MTKINTKDTAIPTAKQFLRENRVNPFETKMEWYSCILRDGNNYKNMTCLQEIIKKLQLCLPEILQGPISLRITLALLEHQDAIYSSVLADCHIIRASPAHYAAPRWCSSEPGTGWDRHRASAKADANFLSHKHCSLLAPSHKQTETGTAHSIVNATKQPVLAENNCKDDWMLCFKRILKSPGWLPSPT